MKKAFKFVVALNLAFNAIQSQNITFNSNELYPEGVAYYSKQDVFFVSSLHFGKIGKVDKKGTYTEFINEPELVSSLGLLVDEQRNLLYVAVSDPGVSTKTDAKTQGKLAKLISYDITTGKRKMLVDLGALNLQGGNFANDIAIDKLGNLYVTNSFSPLIFIITQKGQASVFAKSDLWKGEGFNLNGIVYHPDGYLLVSQSNTGFIYKVSIKDPTQIIQVKLPAILGADGLVLNDKNELVVISNSSQEVAHIKTTDSWETASVVEKIKTNLSFPTTGTKANNKVYVLNAKLNELFDPKATKTSNFILQEIELKKK